MEETWIDVIEKMQVSKIVKNYIVSIDEETKEYFEKFIKSIKERIKDEVLSSSLVSGNYAIGDIMEDESRKFTENVSAVVDYYVEGIYHSGKTHSRNKLKLPKQKPIDGHKYYFNYSDKLFIDGYKYNQINKIKVFIQTLLFKKIQDFIRLKLNGEWVADDDNDYQFLQYKNQKIDEEDLNNVFVVIENSLSSTYEELIETIIREVIVLFQRAQIQEYDNLNINTITTYADDDERCCSICSVKSGKIYRLQDILDGQFGIKDGIEHALCKYSIEPVISYRDQITSLYYMSSFSKKPEDYQYSNTDPHLNQDIKSKVNLDLGKLKFFELPIEMEKRVQSLVSKLKIYFSEYFSETIFTFKNDITNDEDWIDSVKRFYLEKGNNDFQANNLAFKEQDNLTNQVASFNDGKKILISSLSFDSQPIENLILRELFRWKVKVNDEVKKIYNNKVKTKKVAHGVAIYQDPFISYLAEESEYEYLLESIVFYIVQPNKLQYVDEKIYKYIEENLSTIMGE